MQELIQSAKGGVALAPVTVIVPTRLAGLQLRRSVSEGVEDGPGLLNVSFRTLEAAAELIGTPLLAAEGKTPFSEIVKLKATELALNAEPSLAKLAGHAPSVRKIARLLTDIRDAESSEKLTGPLAAVQAEFLRLIAPYSDTRDNYEAATRAVEERSPALAELGVILFCEPLPGISAPAMRFLGVLAAASGLDEGAIAGLSGRSSSGLRNGPEPPPSRFASSPTRPPALGPGLAKDGKSNILSRTVSPSPKLGSRVPEGGGVVLWRAKP